MSKIITINQAAKLSTKFKQSGKSIVLVGGCFDILHPGHTLFLEKASQYGDLLFVLLESDENIKRRKGMGRPINSQKNRAIVLSVLGSVDFVVLLEGVTKNQDYDKLIVQIKPDIIGLTRGDENIPQREKQCRLVGAKLEVIDRIEGVSTSGLILKK